MLVVISGVKKILLTSVMIGVGEKEFSFAVDFVALPLRFCAHNHQFDAHFFDAQLVHRLNVRVGDDNIHVFHVADFGKSASAKLRCVGQNDGLLCSLHHLLVKVSLAHVGRGEAEIEIDAVDTHKQFTE